MGSSLQPVDLGTGRTAVRVIAGGRHTCVLLLGGSVLCWGHNGYGQLGVGTTSNVGDNVGEMGDNLRAVNLGAGHAEALATIRFQAIRTGLTVWPQLPRCLAVALNSLTIGRARGCRPNRGRHRRGGHTHLRASQRRGRVLLGQQRGWSARQRRKREFGHPAGCLAGRRWFLVHKEIVICLAPSTEGTESAYRRSINSLPVGFESGISKETGERPANG